VQPARLTGMAGLNTVPTAAGPPPLARLYERGGLPAWGLPQELADVYGGDLGFPEPCVYANFVASLDGVTALGPEYPSSGSAISGDDPADRFVMGLLRACADIVLIGAGTLRATPGHRWTPGMSARRLQMDTLLCAEAWAARAIPNLRWSPPAARCPSRTLRCATARLS